MCHRENIHSTAAFDNRSPPIIVANVKSFSKRIDEGYEPKSARLPVMKRLLTVGCKKYVILTLFHVSNSLTTKKGAAPNRKRFHT